LTCKHAGCSDPATEDGLCLGHHPEILTFKGKRVVSDASGVHAAGGRQQEPAVNVSEQKRRCRALTVRGEPCRSPTVGPDGLCATHSGRAGFGTVETAKKGAEASVRARRERAEAREAKAEEAKMSLTELLRLRALERREELVKALLDAAAAGRDVPALRMVWERLDGRVAEKIEVMSPEDAALLERLREARARVAVAEMSTEERIAFIRRVNAQRDEAAS
jgi:hypothetical protein